VTVSSSSTEVRDAKERARAPDRIPAFLRALLLLGLVAAGGWLLSRLGQLDPPPPRVREFADRLGNRLVLVEACGAPGRRSRPARAVMSRVPLRVRPRRSLLIFAEDGARRILPPGVPAVLVHADRRIEPVSTPLPPLVLLRLEARPPGAESLPAWFQRPQVQRALAGAAPRLREFWAK
jgi:hypothetical protein